MRRFLSVVALCAVALFAAPSMAEDKPAAPAPLPRSRCGTCRACGRAPPAARPPRPAAAAPTPNKGDTAWMITATAFVILMTIPGLALFYGGMVRTKNSLSMLMQVFSVFALLSVLWAIYGYSIAFTEGNSFFGGFSRLFLKGVTPDSTVATFSKGVVIPSTSTSPSNARSRRSHPA
jgi:Amt family ammonium transporter